MLAAATMSMQAPHKRPEAIDIAVILSCMLPPFKNRGLDPNFDGSILLPCLWNCMNAYLQATFGIGVASVIRNRSRHRATEAEARLASACSTTQIQPNRR